MAGAIDDVEKKALASEREHEWAKASDLFLKVAHHYKDGQAFDQAADYFMRAAVAGERAETWRRLGALWVHCAVSLESRSSGAVSDLYDQMEASSHYFPTLDFHAWSQFTNSQRVGRAYRNAAYHLEKAGSNQSAYVQYTKSGHAFRKGKEFAEASRSYYHALLAFIERNGEIDQEALESLEAVNQALMKEDYKRYLKRIQLYYRSLAGRLMSKGNYVDAYRLFSQEQETTRRLALRERRLGKWLLYSAWKYTSWYGNSFALWGLWAVALFLAAFPILYWGTGTIVWQETARSASWFDYVFFSFATVTTAADPSFYLPVVGKALAALEGLIGLLMLGSLVIPCWRRRSSVDTGAHRRLAGATTTFG